MSVTVVGPPPASRLTRPLGRLVRAAIDRTGAKPGAIEITLTDDAALRALNQSWRGIDRATDVLSFRGEEGYLGDILISTETAFEQARKSATLTFDANIHRLLLHGFLHLSGYDHETDNGEMRAVERRLRRKFEC